METSRKEEIENTEFQYLDFVRVGEREYMLFNKRTERFHDAELGIDFIPNEKVEILAEVAIE